MAISSLAASLGLHRLPPVEDGEGLDPVWFPGAGVESNDMEATSRSQTWATIRQITAKLPVTWQKIKWLIVVSAQDSHALLCQLLFTVQCGPTRIWLAIREVYCNVAVRTNLIIKREIEKKAAEGCSFLFLKKKKKVGGVSFVTHLLIDVLMFPWSYKARQESLRCKVQ